MKLPISVILPIYKHEKTLGRSIESMLAQSFTDFELLLIDNNSNEQTYEIASTFAEKDKRIKIISELKQGQAHALNKGLENAAGEYIALMEAYDEAFPQRLEKQHAYLEQHSGTDLVSCLVEYTGDDDFNYTSVEQVKWINRIITNEELAANRFIDSPVLASTILYRRSLIERCGMYKQTYLPAEYEMCLRLYNENVRMHKLPEVLVNWKDIEDRNDTLNNKYIDVAAHEIKTSYLHKWLVNRNPELSNIIVWGAGRVSRQRWMLMHDLGVSARYFIDQRANPEKNVVEAKHTPPAGKNFIVSYVAHHEAREKVKSFLVELGYMEGKDFICFA